MIVVVFAAVFVFGVVTGLIAGALSLLLSRPSRLDRQVSLGLLQDGMGRAEDRRGDSSSERRSS